MSELFPTAHAMAKKDILDLRLAADGSKRKGSLGCRAEEREREREREIMQ